MFEGILARNIKSPRQPIIQINNANFGMNNRNLAAYSVSAITSISCGAWAVFTTQHVSNFLGVMILSVGSYYLGCMMGVVGIIAVYFQVKKLIMAQIIANSVATAVYGFLTLPQLLSFGSTIPDEDIWKAALSICPVVFGIVCSVVMAWYWATMDVLPKPKEDIELDEIKCDVATGSKGEQRMESEEREM
eukprot:718772_1